MGWECPRCGRRYSPFTAECLMCGPGCQPKTDNQTSNSDLKTVHKRPQRPVQEPVFSEGDGWREEDQWRR